MSINATHVWALWNHCVCLVIIIRECFRNLNWSLQLEHTELGLKRKLKKGEAWQKMSPGSFYSSTKLSSRKKKINENSSGKRQSTHFLGASVYSRDLLSYYLVRKRERDSCLSLPCCSLLSLCHASLYKVFGHLQHDFNKGYWK